MLLTIFIYIKIVNNYNKCVCVCVGGGGVPARGRLFSMSSYTSSTVIGAVKSTFKKPVYFSDLFDILILEHIV